MAVIDINDKAPSWAAGCFECQYGVIAPGTPETFTTLHLVRLAAFLEGSLQLCTCKAGQMYRIYLLNLERKYIEEMRNNKLFAPGQHPEVKQAIAYLRSLQ
jgi:hypothetical protein